MVVSIEVQEPEFTDRDPSMALAHRQVYEKFCAGESFSVRAGECEEEGFLVIYCGDSYFYAKLLVVKRL